MAQGKFIRIKLKNKKALKEVSLSLLEDSIKDEILLLLAETLSEFDNYKDLITDNLSKKILNKISKIIEDEELSEKQKKRQILNLVQREIKNTAEKIAFNDTFDNVNKTEFRSAKAGERVGIKKIKKWITQFDSRVRPWHDIVNHQTRKNNDFFDVPVGNTGAVDKARHPKASGMSPLNYNNCRCYVEYEII